jgi:L,D-peptidoglycan transpeptidase YkuD (ErfK/YbiS/YcfS/YnhG family)
MLFPSHLALASRLLLAGALLPAIQATGAEGQQSLDVGLIAGSNQHVLVVVEDPDDTRGLLYPLQGDATRWRLLSPPVPVVVGMAGVDKKREGDHRAPTGAFPLSRVFGYAPEAPPGVGMPYLPLSAESQCVDDPDSPFYGRIVEPRDPEAESGWRSAEWMRRDLHHGDDLYRWGVVVEYGSGTGPTSDTAVGSCIFLHVWRDSDSPTAGCTAMRESDLMTLLQWLRPEARPILVQGPRAFLEEQARSGVIPYPIPKAGGAS